MAYIRRKLIDLHTQKIPAYKVLMNALNLSISHAQRLIDKKRLFCQNELVKSKNEHLSGLVELIEYENKPRGVKIIFEDNEFAVLLKPSGVLSHPNGRHCEYSLCDEIWHLWGMKACVAHRLDKGTSGLILVAKNEKTQIILKNAFLNKEVEKEYLALVKGETKPEFKADFPLNLALNYDDVKMRMCVDFEKGKEALSHFERLFHDKNLNLSFIKCVPKTGRQHQLRVHLHALNHTILGDNLYGLKKEQIESILDEKLSKSELISLTGASRLLLHASCLKFKFKGKKFKFVDEKGVKEEFLASLK